MNSFFQISYFFSLIPSVIICGAWWFAATRRRNVPILFWLAATHSFSLVVSVLQMLSAMGERSFARMQSLSAVGTLAHVALAGLYVVFVRWLVSQPGDS